MDFRRRPQEKLNFTITIAVDLETKNRFNQLKDVHDVNVAAWVRALIKKELPKLEKELEQFP